MRKRIYKLKINNSVPRKTNHILEFLDKTIPKPITNDLVSDNSNINIQSLLYQRTMRLYYIIKPKTTCLSIT